MLVESQTKVRKRSLLLSRITISAFVASFYMVCKAIDLCNVFSKRAFKFEELQVASLQLVNIVLCLKIQNPKLQIPSTFTVQVSTSRLIGAIQLLKNQVASYTTTHFMK